MTPHQGLTQIEAVEFLGKEFPEVTQWTCWTPGYTIGQSLEMIVGKGYQLEGKIGSWHWSRERCSYPKLALWDGWNIDPSRADEWVGVLKIRSETGEEFLLFSFLNSSGGIGHLYLASTYDVRLLDRFGRAVQKHFHPPDELIIRVIGGPEVVLSSSDEEEIFLPDNLRRDIEQQVFSFFDNAENYRQMHLRHRRGYIFVGSPGNGKTMMLRHLVRQCHRRYHTAALLLNITRYTNDRDIAALFWEAAQNTPALVILEDLDSLTTECQVSRAYLLAQLDGLDTAKGLLIIGTSNNPERIDPALAHRPSRFDRVWSFRPPDAGMRRRYLQSAFGSLDASIVSTIAEGTRGWSFAYLNELRTTAAVLAIDRKGALVTEEDVQNAYDLLTPQFRAGSRNHTVDNIEMLEGFRAT